MKLSERLLAQCTGCAACAAACPSGALSMKPDMEGFPFPRIDEKACTDCGRCMAVCPVLHPERPGAGDLPEPARWAFRGNEDLRDGAAWGGAIEALAGAVLSHGGAVFGPDWSQGFTAVQECIRSAEDLPRLQGLKCVQSLENGACRKTAELLRKGTPVLWIGTPCQIAGLRSLFKGEPASLATVEIACRGAASPLALKEWLDREFGRERPEWISFVGGPAGLSAICDMPEGREERFEGGESAFLLGAQIGMFMRPSCRACPCAKGPRRADLTLGGVWDSQSSSPGPWSIVLAGSRKGAALWKTALQSAGAGCTVRDLSAVPLPKLGAAAAAPGAPVRPEADNYPLLRREGRGFRSAVVGAALGTDRVGVVPSAPGTPGGHAGDWALCAALEQLGKRVLVLDHVAPLPAKAKAVFAKRFALSSRFMRRGNAAMSCAACDAFFSRPRLDSLDAMQALSFAFCTERPRIAWGVQFGEEDGDPDFRPALKTMLGGFAFVSAEDGKAEQLMKQIGIKSFRVPPAVLLAEPKEIPAELLEKPLPPESMETKNTRRNGTDLLARALRAGCPEPVVQEASTIVAKLWGRIPHGCGNAEKLAGGNPLFAAVVRACAGRLPDWLQWMPSKGRPYMQMRIGDLDPKVHFEMLDRGETPMFCLHCERQELWDECRDAFFDVSQAWRVQGKDPMKLNVPLARDHAGESVLALLLDAMPFAARLAGKD